jgi:hypothetical protein
MYSLAYAHAGREERAEGTHDGGARADDEAHDRVRGREDVEGRRLQGHGRTPGSSRTDHLQVGKEAPEFEATDENGAKWKLSDYRGKVVVLDFWGIW